MNPPLLSAVIKLWTAWTSPFSGAIPYEYEAADPVFAHHLAKFNRQLVTGRIAAIGSSDHAPSAEPQHLTGRGDLYATDCHAHASITSQRHWYQI